MLDYQLLKWGVIENNVFSATVGKNIRYELKIYTWRSGRRRDSSAILMYPKTLYSEGFRNIPLHLTGLHVFTENND